MNATQEADVIAPRLQIHTRERRFLLRDVSAIETIVRGRGAPVEYVPGLTESLVTTIYFDTAEGTWSRGRASTKFRCKCYNGSAPWWFELKRRSGTVVDKWRRPVSPEELQSLLDGSRRTDALARFIGSAPLLPLAVVTYRRTAFEWTGLRVTIDRAVRFHRPDGLGAGPLLGELAHGVFEVKRDGRLPDWLREPLKGTRVRTFSKSKRALMLLRNGTARTESA